MESFEESDVERAVRAEKLRLQRERDSTSGDKIPPLMTKKELLLTFADIAQKIHGAKVVEEPFNFDPYSYEKEQTTDMGHEERKSAPPVVVIDGIIGAGKSSLIDILREELTKRGWRVTVVKEPVDSWKETGILQRFYADPKRWAYHFQTTAFHDRVAENIKMYEEHGEETDIFLLERSPFTDTLFMELLHETGVIDDLEMADYRRWWSLWYKVMPYQPSVFIYLKPDVEVCMKRLRGRNRDGEGGISLEYQQLLGKKHDSFFHNQSVMVNGKEVLCFTIESYANDNFKDDPQARAKIFEYFARVLIYLRVSE